MVFNLRVCIGCTVCYKKKCYKEESMTYNILSLILMAVLNADEDFIESSKCNKNFLII